MKPPAIDSEQEQGMPTTANLKIAGQRLAAFSRTERKQPKGEALACLARREQLTIQRG